jgi:hypothetical protein
METVREVKTKGYQNEDDEPEGLHARPSLNRMETAVKLSGHHAIAAVRVPIQSAPS